MTEFRIEEIQELLSREALETSKRWHRIMDPEDIVSEAWVRIYENRSLHSYVENGNNKQVRSALRRLCNSVCAKERMDYDSFCGRWLYNNDDTRNLLAAKAQGFELSFDEKVDLETGLELLLKENPARFEAIYKFFYLEEDAAESRERKQKSLALTQLTALMNRGRIQREDSREEGLGTRKVNPEEVESD
ncbi:hypothetical protein [Corynebacterium propinquum]